ncbi:MAG: putative bifunctional diguanylate cyclase/phosphodiesterase, partial [Salinibacter sp.]
HKATHDQLTGLLRDSVLRERVRQGLETADERGGALLYIDLDRFKNVNDSFGHHVGDAVLMEAADRLRNVVRDTDDVGRVGGDEFVVWSSPLPDDDTAVTMAQRTAEALQRPYEVEDHCLQVGASVGLVTDGSGHADADSLIQSADAAMYRAKTSSTQSVARHGSSTTGDEDNLSLEAAVRRGVERGAFEPFLLPVVRLDDGALTGFEVLARWRRENGHLAAPDTFLDVAEDTGMIVPIGRRVIEDACRGLQSLRENKTLDLSMTLSGNFSRQEFFRDETCNFIRRLLDTYDLSPSDFTMEITERVAEDETSSGTEAVDKLKALGVNIEVDDFGTGYSSMHSLLKFPVDGLKIDKSFTAEVASSDAGRALVRSVVEMARDLDLYVTAEGIETAEQLSVLRDLGCRYGQGYLFSEPVSVEEVEAVAACFPMDLSAS